MQNSIDKKHFKDFIDVNLQSISNSFLLNIV